MHIKLILIKFREKQKRDKPLKNSHRQLNIHANTRINNSVKCNQAELLSNSSYAKQETKQLKLKSCIILVLANTYTKADKNKRSYRV